MMTLTAQEVFDTAYLGVMRQGRRSIGPKGGCKYRGEGGLKCAVGWLLTDEEAAGVEGDSAFCLMTKGRLPDRLVPHVSLLEYLQEAHDSSLNGDGIDYFARRAPEIAAEGGLTVPEVTP